jgi:hypothetical protein
MEKALKQLEPIGTDNVTAPIKQEDMDASVSPITNPTQIQPPQQQFTQPHSNIFRGIPIAPDTMVHFKSPTTDITGHIMNLREPTFKNGYWHYDIYTAKEQELTSCSGKYIHPVVEQIGPDIKENQPTHQHQQPISHYFDTAPQMAPRYESPHRRKRSQSHQHEQRTMGTTLRQLEQHEFIYPLGTKPTTVWTNDLNKAAAKWKLKLRDENDLRTAYERLQTRLSSYNVWLIEYDQITKQNQCCAVTPEICENFEHARALMSKSLYMIMDDNQDTYFEHYTEPITFLSAYRREQDGFAFITHMMEAIHPNLKTISNRQAPAAPKFNDHENLYEFINSYIDWIEDEFIRAKREYTDRERIDYIRSELDSRFHTAKTKIESKLDELDTHEDIKFPSNLKLTSKLAKYIISLLKVEDQSRVNKISTMPQDIINVTKHSNIKDNKRHRKEYTNDTKWADELKWEILPGEFCTACGKNNHNVYKTGCPALATFAYCQTFMDKTPAKQLEPVLKAYKKYQRDLGRKLRDRRNNDRRTLRALKAANWTNEDITEVKDTLFVDYKRDYLDEQYVTQNPLDDLEDETDTDSEE